MIEMYRLVMDSDKNPLSTLPPAQRFQFMTYLGLMWTVVFCTAFGFVITGLTFRSAQKNGGYRDHPREDGTARYDDVWGG
jgi:hypothetical protein